MTKGSRTRSGSAPRRRGACRRIRPPGCRPRGLHGGVALGELLVARRALGLVLGLVALDTGLGLGLGELGLEGLGGDLLGDVDDERLGVGDEGGALGDLDLGGEDLGAGLEALDGDDDRLGDARDVGLDLEGLGVDGDDGLRTGLALDVHGDLDGDLLALLDDDEVDVLDPRLEDVALHVLARAYSCWPSTTIASSALALYFSAIIVS